MPAYTVGDVHVADADAYEQYRLIAPATIAKYGGRYLVRGGVSQILEGHWEPGRLVVLEFETVEQAIQWHQSPEYQEARKLRKECSDTNLVVVDGLETSSIVPVLSSDATRDYR